jgi:rod shape-determining protein MreC
LAKNKQRPNVKPFFFLGIILVAWLLIPTAWKMIFKSAFEEFHAPIWEATSRIRDLSYYWGHVSDSKNTLIEKGRDHQRILSDAYLQISRKEDLQRELDKLRNLKKEITNLEKTLSILPALSVSPELARVTHRTISGWSQYFEINKGENFKINQGAGVISAIGVVGKIEKINYRSSMVQLLTNQEFRIVAHIKGDERPITYRGAGVSYGRQNLGLIMDIPQDVSIGSDGFLEIVSSSLGGSFPQNLSIGKVFELEPSVDGLFQSAQVILSPDLNIIKEVTVLNPDNE